MVTLASWWVRFDAALALAVLQREYCLRGKLSTGATLVLKTVAYRLL